MNNNNQIKVLETLSWHGKAQMFFKSERIRTVSHTGYLKKGGD